MFVSHFLLPQVTDALKKWSLFKSELNTVQVRAVANMPASVHEQLTKANLLLGEFLISTFGRQATIFWTHQSDILSQVVKWHSSGEQNARAPFEADLSPKELLESLRIATLLQLMCSPEELKSFEDRSPFICIPHGPLSL